MAIALNNLYDGGYPHYNDLAFGTHPLPGEDELLKLCTSDEIEFLKELKEDKDVAMQLSLDALRFRGVADPECQALALECNDLYQEYRESLIAQHAALQLPVSRADFDVSAPGRINDKIRIPLLAASSAMRMLIDPNSGYYESVEDINGGGLDNRFAREFALNGGVPIIPFDIPINHAVALVKELKSASLKYRKPLFVHMHTTIGKVRELLMGQIEDAAAYILDEKGRLVHMVSREDVELWKDHQKRPRTLNDGHQISSLMRDDNQQEFDTSILDISPGDALGKMASSPYKQLPIFNDNGQVVHTFTQKQAALSDEMEPFKIDGGLGAMFAVGIGPFNDMAERIDALMQAGAVGFFIETAHAYRRDVLAKAIPVLQQIRQRYPKAVIGFGTITEPEAVELLSHIGFDIVKVGVGGGGHCSTFDVTGVGGLPYRSFRECSLRAAALGNIQVMADGGINSTRRFNIAASNNGTALVQIGTWFGTTAESASKAEFIDGEWRKILFGEASDHAEGRRRKERVIDDKKKEIFEKLQRRHRNDRILGIHSEGKAGHKIIPSGPHGHVGGILRTVKTSLQSFGSYANGKNVQEAQERSHVMRITNTAT